MKFSGGFGSASGSGQNVAAPDPASVIPNVISLIKSVVLLSICMLTMRFPTMPRLKRCIMCPFQSRYFGLIYSPFGAGVGLFLLVPGPALALKTSPGWPRLRAIFPALHLC